MSNVRERGAVALLTVFMTLAIFIVGLTGGVLFVMNERQISRNVSGGVGAYYAVDAGIEDAIYRIRTAKQAPSSYSIGAGTDTAQVTISGTHTRTVTAETTANTKNIFKKLQAILRITTINPQFFYGVQVGEGGVTMEENSRIEGIGGTAGNFYSNGAVTGDNNAVITGDVTVATGIALSENFQVCNADQIAGQANPQIDFAQSFQAGGSKPLAKVRIYIKKVGNPGDRTVYITNNSGGSPAQTSLASGTLKASLVGTSYAWIEVVFSSPPTLIQNNTYWIVLDATQHASKYWVWCKDSGGGYANGAAKYSLDWDHNPWTSVSGDLAFETYLGTGESSIDNVTVYGTVRANTITGSKICGDAYYKSVSSIDSSSKTFLDSPSNPTCGGSALTPGTGFPNQPDPGVSPMPISQANIDQWKADAAGGGTISGNCGDSDQTGGAAPECAIGDNNTLSLGPKKITGNLRLTKKQTLNVTGTLYFLGNLDVDSSGGATIKCDPSFGENSCVIVTDKWMHIKNNVTLQGSGTAGSYIMLLTTLTGCNGGSQQSQCTHHNSAVDIHNNAVGAIFYAPSAMINLHNEVTVSELTAYKLALDNNAVVQYEQGLANSKFSSGAGASIMIQEWKEIP